MNPRFLALPPLLAAALAGCVPPNPLPQRIDPAACRPPTAQGPLSVAPEAMAGSYRMIVYATSGPGVAPVVPGSPPPTMAVANLRLRRNSLVHRFPTKRDSSMGDATPVQSPLYGSSNLDPRVLGARGAIRRVSSRNPEQPGVQTLFYPAWQSITLVLGAPRGPWGGGDVAGVWFDVWEADARSFRGWWTDGPAVATPSAGYFCAERIGR
ncbi:MAG: hypothetical protein H0X64_12915 [Gemmatimonadaceae bacterium]|nr:hypothetical protein [Gemmatimonadaceae bacterium]